jgi:Card1-like, endonuclease domain
MTMNEWKPYQTDHLFLLVGTNPLPNYVAALLLAKDNGTIRLLHSGGAHGTAEVADKLSHAIQKRRPKISHVIPQEIDEANSSRIAQKMREILKDVGQGASVGLNYTGGTKAMAVHVYREIAKKFGLAQFSYLDARTLSLILDGSEGSSTKVISLGQDCQLKLDELMALHGRVLKSCEKEARLQEVWPLLVELHTKSPDVWRRWCQDNLRRSDNGNIKSKTDLRNVQLPVDDLVLTQIFKRFGNFGTLEQIPFPDGWKIDDLAKWLDGKWLEHYVLQVVKQIADNCHVHDYGLNLTTEGKNFEFDVAAMRGYQLFAISCTTGQKNSLCKEKLFEAYTRARQMGGDEARVALVCCHQDPPALLGEIEETWFTEGRVRVFGKQDLADLPARLKDWFETANPVQ